MAEERKDLDDLKQILRYGSDEELRDFLSLLHPADLADLIEQAEPEERDRIFRLLPPEKASRVLPEIEDWYRNEIIKRLSHNQIVEIVDEMPSDEAVDLVSELPPEEARRVLEEIEKEDSEKVRRLLRYPEESAGGIMQVELVSVRANATVSEVIEEIRKKREKVQDLHYVFVVDEDNRLVGVLDLSRLLLAEPDQRVSELMKTDVIKVRVDMDQEQVAEMFRRYNLFTLPVVDREGRLVGRITADDVFEVMADEADEDFLLMAGAGEAELEERNIFKSAWARLPWLTITFVGEMVTGAVIGFYHQLLQQLIVLTTFLPIIMAMGGNVGNQSATIVVRGLATGKIELHKVGKLILHQSLIGFLMGMIIGVVLVVFTQFRYKSTIYASTIYVSTIYVGLVVGLSICLVMTIAALVGTALPLIFKRFKVDPAIATAPFISTFCDALSTLIYLGMANLLLIKLAL